MRVHPTCSCQSPRLFNTTHTNNALRAFSPSSLRPPLHLLHGRDGDEERDQPHHPDHAARAPYAFTDADAAAADLVVTLGGAATERDVASAAPSAANVVDLWEFAQFADVAEIDGTGAAAILQRSLALEVVAPELPHALSLAPGDSWGMETESVVHDESVAAAESLARMESRAQASLRLARARRTSGGRTRARGA